MTNIRSFQKSLLASKIMIEDYIFKCANRISPSCFTRSGKMGFKETIFFILNMANKTLQVELNNFFETVLRRNYSISKQAFSENRQKISPNAFIELNDAINKVFYEECCEFKLWNGYRLSAIDGSILELPNTELLQEQFGYSKNQYIRKTARARVCCIFDVINKIVIKSKIDRYNVPERKMAIDLITEMVKNSSFKELILFDRGYPSNELISKLIDKNVTFVVRLANNIYKKTIDAEKNDQIVKIKYKNRVYTVRVVRFLLESGIEEILLTNLLEEIYTIETLKELYFKRWQIEIKYDELKSRLEIENFTGTTKIAIEQDFYASIYLSNMIELARKESDEIIQKDRKGKNLKYEYKTNLNILVGSLKDKFIMMFLEKSERKRNKIYKEVMSKVKKSCVPIRPNRQYPRIERFLREKYKNNCKRCL